MPSGGDDQDARASVFVARRSSGVGTYPDVLHVVPSGMMNSRSNAQPTAEELASLPRLTMMSEFLEEWFRLDTERLASLWSAARRASATGSP